MASARMMPHIDRAQDGYDVHRVEVKLQIPKEMSRDGQMKEVEFTFNTLRDRFEVSLIAMLH